MASGSGGPDRISGASEDQLPPRRPRPGRGLLVLAAAALIAAVLLGSLASGRGPAPSPGPSSSSPATTSSTSSPASPSADGGPGSSPTPTTSGDLPLPAGAGYLATKAELLDRARRAANGEEPYRTAVDDLLGWADRTVDDRPHPAARLRIRGTEGHFVDDTATAYGLALAYVVADDPRYGEAAARFIMAWVDTTTSTAGTCPDSGSCQTSLIISRTVPGFVFAADLLDGSGLLRADDLRRFRDWLRDVMLPTASELTNNWGDAGVFTRVVLTDYLGDRAGYTAAIEAWRRQTDLIAADGHIPAEVARGEAGLGYTQEALDYKVAVAVIAERRHLDLWTYQGAAGGSLRSAIDLLATYMDDPSGWPWASNVRRRPPSPFWELAYAHWQDPAYALIVDERRPYGSLGHSAVRWTTLTNGIATSGS